MIVAKTEIIRARVTQELRVVLPPCGQRVMYDPSAPCPREIYTADDRALLAAAGFTDEVGPDEQYFGREVFVGAVEPLVRTVQILVPSNPRIYFDLDVDPVNIGPNRAPYKLPTLAAGTTIKIDLHPDQWMVAAADEGTGLLTFIVEYHAAEGL
jgi:hypothetical protein